MSLLLATCSWCHNESLIAQNISGKLLATPTLAASGGIRDPRPQSLQHRQLTAGIDRHFALQISGRQSMPSDPGCLGLTTVASARFPTDRSNAPGDYLVSAFEPSNWCRRPHLYREGSSPQDQIKPVKVKESAIDEPTNSSRVAADWRLTPSSACQISPSRQSAADGETSSRVGKDHTFTCWDAMHLKAVCRSRPGHQAEQAFSLP